MSEFEAVLTKSPRVLVSTDAALSPDAMRHVREVVEEWLDGPRRPVVVDRGITLHFLDEDGRVVSTVPDSRPLEPVVLEASHWPWVLNVASIALSTVAIVLVLLR